jgi:GNAT superfamily N-acetyltransferase
MNDLVGGADNLDPETWMRIGESLTARFGCAAEALRAPGVHVIAHGGAFADYHGIYVWAMRSLDILESSTEPVVIVSAPTRLIPAARAALAAAPADSALDPTSWVAELGEQLERIVGPSYQGYLDRSRFLPAASLLDYSARPLAPEQRPALAVLAQASGAEAWAHSAIQRDHDPIFAVVDAAGAIKAAASITSDPAGIASMGVITHPAARGRGYGRAVVSALTAWALERGFTPHYQTLRANSPSVAIARALGYQDVATALALRLCR